MKRNPLISVVMKLKIANHIANLKLTLVKLTPENLRLKWKEPTHLGQLFFFINVLIDSFYKMITLVMLYNSKVEEGWVICCYQEIWLSLIFWKPHNLISLQWNSWEQHVWNKFWEFNWKPLTGMSRVIEAATAELGKDQCMRLKSAIFLLQTQVQ